MNINFNKIGLFGLIIAAIMIVTSCSIIWLYGLNLGIDFEGGSVIELKTDSNINQIRTVLEHNTSDFILQQTDSYYIIHLSHNTNLDLIKSALSKHLKNVEYIKIDSIGPKISKELIYSSVYAIVLSIIAILVYIWLRFEWQFSVGAIVALFHDIIVTLGFVSYLQLQFNTATVAAFLLILGYSINDTIVVFSRIRENLGLFSPMNSIPSVVNQSLNETFKRTLITSFTTMAILASIIIFGGNVLFDFCLTMLIGVIVGTFSSICVASPVLLLLNSFVKHI